MTTIERQRDDTRTTTPRHATGGPRNLVLVVLGLVLALVVGGLAGYLIRGDGTEDVGPVVPAETELTARHEQMGEMMVAYEKAWQEGDGAAAEAMFAPGGTLRALGETYRADDGEIADFVAGADWSSLDVFEPMLVRDDMALSFHMWDVLRTNEITFTTSGEVLILSHVIGS